MARRQDKQAKEPKQPKPGAPKPRPVDKQALKEDMRRRLREAFAHEDR